MTYNLNQDSIADQLDSLKRFDENGNECWYARDLISILDYGDYTGISRCLRRTVFNLLQEGLTPDFYEQDFQYVPQCNPNLEDKWKHEVVPFLSEVLEWDKS